MDQHQAYPVPPERINLEGYLIDPAGTHVPGRERRGLPGVAERMSRGRVAQEPHQA